ncbi:MAG TPA: serine hydrolase domain-containing protein [Vicinamibacterales bacterium]|nr:serine hydrolase domain-containing protein [Vicinamibacterales bacterium]
MSLDDARAVIERAVGARVFPAAAIEVGSRDGAIWSEGHGTLTFDANAAPVTDATIFDLASLTKPIATTTVLMELVRAQAVSLDAPVAGFFDDWRGVDREQVTVRDLLEHASGLPARLVDLPPGTRREFEHEIGAIRLEYEPRTRSVYSDLGFILLGFLAADVGGAPLDVLFEGIAVRLTPDTTEFNREARRRDRGAQLQPNRDRGLIFTVAVSDRPLTAPTEPMDGDPRRGRRLVGEVHDNYAAALGGVAGHAGLFGTAPAVGAFARAMMRGDEMVRLFTARSTVPGSSRALGWDTMLPTSSCGTRMSPDAFGHVGFTGTSLWIDPARDRYFVLLTNRVCGGGTLDQMREVRRAFHDALGDV